MSVVYDKTYHAVTEHSTFKRRKLLSTVLNNLDRFFNELFSPKDMEGIVANTPITVVSAVALKAATVAGKALTCVSCYFGNYDVVKFIVIQQPGNVAGLYHPLNNKLIHKRYFVVITAVGGKLFLSRHQDFSAMICCLRGCGLMAFLMD